jgi:hypothetical protein
MPNDVFYGADCEVRIGIMADAVTDPTAWFNLEYISLTVTPTRDRNPRPKLGRTLNNTLDPVKPVDGFFRLAAELVVDADTRLFPRLMRLCLGAPTTTGSSAPYTHVWASGSKASNLFAIQVRTAADEVRVFRGMVFSALSTDGKGDQVENYDMKLSLKGASRERVADWLTGAAAALPSAAPGYRMTYLVNDVEASNVLSASWSYDRQIAEDLFMTQTPEVAGLRPNGGEHSGNAQIRAVGAAFDDLEEDGTVFDAKLKVLGLVAGQSIVLQHTNSLLNAAPIVVNGPGELERTFAWTGHQSASAPATKITVVNDVASYAT